MEPTFELTSLTPGLSKMGSAVPESEQKTESATAQLASSFSKTLSDKLSQVESTQRDAQQKMRLFAAGKIENVHDVTIAMQKANMAMRTATLVREKMIGIFDQLKRMQ